MAAEHRDISAPTEEIFRVLANGWLYPHWTMGPRRVHIQPKDLFEVLESEPPRRLSLRVRGWPSGLARLDIHLVPIRGGTRVSIRERPERGVALAFRLPLLEEFLASRLREMLSRLSKLAERIDAPDARP